jgi:release factor glutamine methyltransferase
MGVKIQTFRDIRNCLSEELRAIYPEPEINALANMIIKTFPEVKKLHQIYDPDQVVSTEYIALITTIIRELKNGKPIQYILGSTDFYNCIIKVTKATLIPRQETEELVDLIISENNGYNGNIVDFGTGSGCIAIALAKNLTASSVTGIDISAESIALARENADLNNVNLLFRQEDIFNPVEVLTNKAGIVVSNPPYVRISEKSLMSRNVLEHEPASALFVNDSDPLVYYKAILNISETILQPGGKIYFEINEALGKEMISLLKEYKYTEIILVKDINGKDRILKAKPNGRKLSV